MNKSEKFDLGEFIKNVIPKLDDMRIQRIVNAYNQDWRKYHNSEHIGRMVESLHKHDILLPLEQKRQLQIMFIYHDVSHELGLKKGTSKLHSADWAQEDLLSVGEQNELIVSVREGILATIDHDVEDVPLRFHRLTKYLVDIDLYVRMVDSSTFRNNTKLIIKEYNSQYTLDEITNELIRFAEDTLEKDPIFLTQTFKRYENIFRGELYLMAQQVKRRRL